MPHKLCFTHHGIPDASLTYLGILCMTCLVHLWWPQQTLWLWWPPRFEPRTLGNQTFARTATKEADFLKQQSKNTTAQWYHHKVFQTLMVNWELSLWHSTPQCTQWNCMYACYIRGQPKWHPKGAVQWHGTMLRCHEEEGGEHWLSTSGNPWATSLAFITGNMIHML